MRQILDHIGLCLVFCRLYGADRSEPGELEPCASWPCSSSSFSSPASYQCLCPSSHRQLADGELTVRRLDLDTVRIVSWVLAQSIVLQYYEQVTDRLYDSVETLNKKIQEQALHNVRQHPADIRRRRWS